MNHDELVRVVAPCGLDCGRCLSNPQSPISGLSRDLRGQLGGFAALAGRFAGMDPVFANYDGFADVLDRLADAGCTGCRSGQCLLSSCKVGACVAERGVDWCFQCAQFPCQDTGLPPLLLNRWKMNNERMRDVGPEAYFAAMRKEPRY